MQPRVFLIGLALLLPPSECTDNTAELAAVPLSNPSFESSSGWSSLNRGSSELWAPVEGSRYARKGGGDSPSHQTTSALCEAGKTYTLTAYARSIDESYVGQLPYDLNAGTHKTVEAEVYLTAGDAKVATTRAEVHAPQLKGAAKAGKHPSDDGMNIWEDGDYRMHDGGPHFYQRLGDDPIKDAWTRDGDSPEDAMAIGPVHIGSSGLKALYTTHYRDDEPPFASRIDKVEMLGVPPTYSWQDPEDGPDDGGHTFGETVLRNSGKPYEVPWVIDAHLVHDDETNRLWMTWGGHELWITEMDPISGRVLDPNTNAPVTSNKFKNHAIEPNAVHHRLMSWGEARKIPEGYENGHTPAPEDWEGDVFSVAYTEGPALWKHKEAGGRIFWYACGSHGSMGSSYTIRCCRTPYGPDGDATGLYRDKEGLSCLDYHEDKDRFGASMLLGPDGDQLVPGHPHFYEHGGVTYIGYDFRWRCPSEGEGSNCPDTVGLRKVEWVEDENLSDTKNGWPTIWTKLRASFTVGEGSAAVGRPLGVGFRNTGQKSGTAAFDFFRVVASGEPAPTSEPSPTAAPTAAPTPTEPSTAGTVDIVARHLSNMAHSSYGRSTPGTEPSPTTELSPTSTEELTSSEPSTPSTPPKKKKKKGKKGGKKGKGKKGGKKGKGKKGKGKKGKGKKGKKSKKL